MNQPSVKDAVKTRSVKRVNRLITVVLVCVLLMLALAVYKMLN